MAMSEGARILVIDDEQQIRRMLKTALSGYGYNIGEAATAKEGLSQAAIFHPTSSFYLGLPDADGMEVIRHLREWTQVPIIVLSLREGETDKIGALDAGGDDYLTKPFAWESCSRIRVACATLPGATTCPSLVPTSSSTWPAA